MPRDLHVDMEELAREIRLTDKAFAASLRKNIRKAVTESGAEMVAAVREKASWSTRIPAATSMQTLFAGKVVRVAVRVNAKKAPHARPYEMGNRNDFSEAVAASGGYRVVNGRRVAVDRTVYKKALKSGTGVSRSLRFPVFHKIGEPGGFGQVPTRPFFFAAAKEIDPVVETKIQAAIDTVAFEAGFKGR